MLTVLTETIKINNKTRVTPCTQGTTDVRLVVDVHNGAVSVSVSSVCVVRIWHVHMLPCFDYRNEVGIMLPKGIAKVVCNNVKIVLEEG